MNLEEARKITDFSNKEIKNLPSANLISAANGFIEGYEAAKKASEHIILMALEENVATKVLVKRIEELKEESQNQKIELHARASEIRDLMEKAKPLVVAAKIMLDGYGDEDNHRPLINALAKFEEEK